MYLLVLSCSCTDWLKPVCINFWRADFLSVLMRKLNKRKFLVVLPVIASLFMTVGVTTRNDSLSLEESENKTDFYEVSDKYEKIPAPKLAGGISEESLKVEIPNEFSQSKMRIEDQVFSEKEMKALKIVSKKDEKTKIEVDDKKEETASKDKEQFEKMTEGYPIDEMLPYILKRDPITAAFIVAIAKKESNWGKRAPYHNGKNCFNYWGFKDKRFTTVLGGHSCFPSAEKAVEAVGNRIEKLVKSGFDTPSEFVIWKCGKACKSDGGASKWISDVGLYYNKLKNSKKS